MISMSPFWKQFFSGNSELAHPATSGGDELEELMRNLAMVPKRERGALIEELFDLALSTSSEASDSTGFVFNYVAVNRPDWLSGECLLKIEQVLGAANWRRRWKMAAQKGSRSEGWQIAVNLWSILAKNGHPKAQQLFHELLDLVPDSYMAKNLTAVKAAIEMD